MGMRKKKKKKSYLHALTLKITMIYTRQLQRLLQDHVTEDISSCCLAARVLGRLKKVY